MCISGPGGNNAINTPTCSNYTRPVPRKSHGIGGDFRETHRQITVLRGILRKRRSSCVDGPIILWCHVLHADKAGVPEKRVRHLFSQIPDEGGYRTRLSALRRHPSRKRCLEEPLYEAGLQKEFPDGPRHP